MAASPKWHPDAIDVTGPVPVNGKAWSGGSGNRKVILHTIEGADYPVLGWPRDWTRWKSAPHLAMNAHDWPNGDWLYQTLRFDVAGYAIRDNNAENDRYVWQIEIAGMSALTGGYPDDWYRALAEVCAWFVTEMGVPNHVHDIGSSNRLTTAQLDKFAGFIGHRNVGRGVDTHHDPGAGFDTERLSRFIDDLLGGTPPPPPPPPPSEDEMPSLPMYHGWGMGAEADKKSLVAELQTNLNLLPSVVPPLKVDNMYGDKTAAALVQALGNATNQGTMFTGKDSSKLDGLLRAHDIAKALDGVVGEPGPQGEPGPEGPQGPEGPPVDPDHNHPQYAVDGHTHPGNSKTTHKHPGTFTTDGADS